MAHPAMQRAQEAVSLLALVVFLGACSGKDSPSSPTGGGGSPPTTSTTRTLPASGGTVQLADGTAVVFPPGAVPAGTQVSLAKGDPASVVDGPSETQRLLLQLSASVADFAQDVEIRAPLPAGMTSADSGLVSAGVVDDSTGAVQVRPSIIQVFDGKPFLVVRTRHFSNWLFEWLSGKTPPASGGPLTVPYYAQGASNYCWAASLQMVTRAVRHDASRTIPEIVGTMKQDEGGITALSFRTSNTLANLVKARTGVRPTRQVWPVGTWSQLRDYLKREIGLQGRPVALFATHWSHAVVVVGYSGNTFYLHDPASTRGPGSLAYEPRSWADILAGTGNLDNFVTLSVPAPLGSGVLPLRVNFLRGAFAFFKPSGGTGDPASLYEYRWDPTRTEGYSFGPLQLPEGVHPLPGSVQSLRTPGELMVANGHRTDSYQGIVRLTVTAIGAPTGYQYTTVRDLSIGPNSSVGISFPDIPVDTFRYNTTKTTDYFLSAYVAVNNELVDEQSLLFSLAPVVPQISALDPPSGVVGDEVRVRGQGFGTSRFRNQVTLAGTEVKDILSWSDQLIRFKVPSGAQSGDVVVTRGEVPSNKAPFTVQDYRTYQSFDLEWGSPGEKDRVFDIQVKVTLEVEAIQGGWRSVREERSAFNPMDWVKLWFQSRPLSAGQSNQYRLSVKTVEAKTNFGGTLAWAEAQTQWKVRSQETGLVESTLVGKSVEVTEAYSAGSRMVDLILVFTYRPREGDPYPVERDGLFLSFHPTHR